MEYKRLCNTCGKIYCYDDKDVSDNKFSKLISGVAAVGAAASALGGTRYDMYELNKMADRNNAKVVDFEQCPFCSSRDTRIITDAEYEEYKLKETLSGSSKGINIAPGATEKSIQTRIEIFLEEKDFKSAYGYANALLDINAENSYAYLSQILVKTKCSNLDEIKGKRILLSDYPEYKYIKVCFWQ